MKKVILLICGILLPMQNSFTVEEGLYYCIPAHAAHLIQQGNGSVSELMIDTDGVILIIVIGAERIDISDSRFEERKLVEIIANDVTGSIIGRSGSIQFYMDDILHYFYGSIDGISTIAYAEDGMCSKFSQ